MRLPKQKCWTVLVQDFPITAYEAESVETFAVLQIEADTAIHAETIARRWWMERAHIVVPGISRPDFDFTVLDAPIIKVTQ